MASWHKHEVHFRNRYIELVDRLPFRSRAEYEKLVRALDSPERVRGYVEIRYPTMLEPLEQIEELIRGSDTPGAGFESHTPHNLPEPHFDVPHTNVEPKRLRKLFISTDSQ